MITPQSPNQNIETLMSTTIINESSPYSQRSLSPQLSQISNTSNRHSIELNSAETNLLTQADLQFHQTSDMEESITIQPTDLQSTYPINRNPNSPHDDSIFNDGTLTKYQGEDT
jgi:hypothetical protein